MTVLDWTSAVLATAGGFFVLVGGIGALRMPDLYTRMHASSLTDTLGSLLILSALMLQSGLTLPTLKLAAVAAFLLLTSPVASYALGNAALLSGHKPLLGNNPKNALSREAAAPESESRSAEDNPGEPGDRGTSSEEMDQPSGRES